MMRVFSIKDPQLADQLHFSHIQNEIKWNLEDVNCDKMIEAAGSLNSVRMNLTKQSVKDAIMMKYV